MSQAALQITGGSQYATNKVFMERRRSTRHTVTGRVTAVSSNEPDSDARGRICSLQLVDLSDHGIGAIAQEPVTVGTHICVFFPPHGPERGFDLYGTVVRCTPRDWGHEIGIDLDTRPRRAA